MNIYLKEEMKKEKAAASLLIFVTVGTFIIILMGAYLTVMILRQSQLQSDMRMQEIYGQDVNEVNEIYNDLISKYNERPTCDINYIKEEGNIIYNLEFSKNIRNLEVNNIKLYSGTIIEDKISNTITLSTSSPSYEINMTANKKYIISFDYECITDLQEFEIGLYSDTESNLSTKKLIAKSEIEHEDYILDIENSNVQFKILSQIQGNSNITLSNIQIIEINNEEVEIKDFERINNNTYTLKAKYNETLKYVIILDENICTDFNENKNQQKIQII